MKKSIQAEQVKRKARGEKRVKVTGEVFTPMELCFKMVRRIPEEKLRDPSSVYLDQCFGDGNFLVALYKVLTKEYGHPPEQVLNNQLFGVELMPDNVEETRRRLNLKPSMDGWYHMVCADALSYDYTFVVDRREPTEFW